MTHWLLNSLGELRGECRRAAAAVHIRSQLNGTPEDANWSLLRRGAESLEMVVFDLISERPFDWNGDGLKTVRIAAAESYRLSKLLPVEDDLAGSRRMLRTACLAVLGDCGSDAGRWLRSVSWSDRDLKSPDWRKRTWSTIVDIWLRLIRKRGWRDRDAVLKRVAELRDAQAEYEESHFAGLESKDSKAGALELIGLYHLAKAAEVLARFMTDGKVDGRFQIQQMLDTHFDRVVAVCKDSQLLDLEPTARLLEVCASQMVKNSIWMVTRSVNSQVTKFVETLVDRGRGDRALFDVLPPQRRALAERGLLGSSRRAVVVSLPTSSGKTLIAEFRLLQALNQFEHERGWVAYLAPTRTLVHQVTRQLRHDLEPLGILVEQVSPALEVDNVEASFLRQSQDGQDFRVLVTTPEKLDLMLRQGWEQKIGRPLTLVIVDEAHNLQSGSRGLKLELLLATINSWCENAQFLLLTPFIKNAQDVARWLDDQNSDDISLAIDWQPNDRVIGIAHLEMGEELRKGSFDYSVELETVHTSSNTLAIDHRLSLGNQPQIARTYSQASKSSRVAAIAAQALQRRGPVIVMHTQPRWVWSLAEILKLECNLQPATERARLVQDFLRLEYGDEFPLIEMIGHGVGVHHAGLSDDVRRLMEWLFESEDLRFLVATTTIAQGVNFPVSGVVLASHQYPYGEDMPPEDFWNLAGRAGRVGQGELGVIALASNSAERADVLRAFIHRQVGELNSALLQMAKDAADELEDLEGIVYRHPGWSSFLQYLVHSYRQMGRPKAFGNEIEQVLRNTMGFAKLRSETPDLARSLLRGIHRYAAYLQRSGQPLKLVDSTGFSLQSINRVFGQARELGINSDSWDRGSLFAQQDGSLGAMMDVLLGVPELRGNLRDVLGADANDSDTLARILKDWVHGSSLEEMALNYFSESGTYADAVTRCGQNLASKLTQTTAWGLGALLSITGAGLAEERMKELQNLPSQVFYGVATEKAIALRLLGVPRMAANRMALNQPELVEGPISSVRRSLRKMGRREWQVAYGGPESDVYRKVWRVLEGFD